VDKCAIDTLRFVALWCFLTWLSKASLPSDMSSSTVAMQEPYSDWAWSQPSLMDIADGFPPTLGASSLSRSLSSTPAVGKHSPALPYSSSPPSLLSLEAPQVAAGEVATPSFPIPFPNSSQGCYWPTAPPSSSWWPCSGPPLTPPSFGALSTSSSCSPRCLFSGCSPTCRRPHVGQPPSQATWQCILTQLSPPFSPQHGFESRSRSPPLLPHPGQSILQSGRMAIMCHHNLLDSDQASMISSDFEGQSNIHNPPPCHRYILSLPLAPPSHRGLLLIVGCNPSTADANADDPTLAKLRSWASFNGYSHLAVVNLFSYRETSPKKMKTSGSLHFLAGGREANLWISKAASIADDIVLAMGDIAFKSWGKLNLPFQGITETGRARRAGARTRLAEVVELIRRQMKMGSMLLAFCLTKAGNPGHVLYLPNSLKSREQWVDISDTHFSEG